jgi:hypothetical protein|tara:strand:+ start:86 stop:508 length:423 start_codon:yes stop_codon:yes gene_type:complete
MAFDNLIDKAMQTAVGIKDKVGDPSARVGDAILDVVSSLNDSLPHLAKAGYTMDELEIEIGVPPKLIPHFSVDGALVENAENAEQALTDLEGNIIGTTLFKALFKAATLQQKIVINGMSFSRLEIQLGLVPAVRLCYKQQ